MISIRSHLEHWIKTNAEGLQQLFFPHNCAGCGTDLIQENALLCLSCINDLPFTNFHLHQSNPVEKIFRGRIPLISASSYLYFTKDSLLQSLLHQLKYKGNKEVGIYFGKRIGEAYTQIPPDDYFDAVIPLPLHPAKEKKRGYNQASRIAEGICEVLQLPLIETSVKRRIKTNSQTNKSRQERWENMDGIFMLHEEEALYGKHVLLVDDVVTTGATLEACGAELLKAKGVRLSISTLAYTAH